MKSLFLALFVSITLAACAHSPKTAAPEQAAPELKNIVLIQGVHLDGQSWDAVKNHFDPKVYAVMVLDRLGRDTTKPASLNDIAQQSCERIMIDSTLVAHSYGGAIANEMVGLCPSKIRKIIYVSAVVPKTGELPFKLMSKIDSKNYGKIVKFKKKKIIPVPAAAFFKIADPAYDLKSVPVPTLYPEWSSLASVKITYLATRFDAIPKAYVYTDRDIVVSPATQLRYTKRLPNVVTSHLPTGHFPMLSSPDALYQAIMTLL